MASLLRINLLPEDLRRTAASPVRQLHRLPLTWIVAGCLVALPVVLWIPGAVRGRQVKRLEGEIAGLQPKKATVDRLRQETQQLRAQQEAYAVFGGDRLRWARRLNTLSGLTPKGVWFAELALDETKGLVIQGSAIGQGGAEMVSVGQLVQGLKADENFSAAIHDIQIESIKRFQDGEIEIVQFTLTGAMRRADGS